MMSFVDILQCISIHPCYRCRRIPQHSSICFSRVRPVFTISLFDSHSITRIFNALLLAYSAIQITEIRAIFPPDQKGVFSRVPVTVLTDIIPIVTGIAQIAYIGLGWKIYTEFGWKLYKLLGADRRIKKMYAQYQIFESLLKFDVFFWLGFSIQVR